MKIRELRILDDLSEEAKDRERKEETKMNETEKSAAEYLDGPISELPEVCLSILPSDRSAILIRLGIDGFWPTTITNDLVDSTNEKLGVTKNQRLAMELGSMFRWA